MIRCGKRCGNAVRLSSIPIRGENERSGAREGEIEEETISHKEGTERGNIRRHTSLISLEDGR